jgi:hypothetical protein
VGTLLQLCALGLGLFLWGCLLLAVFDRFLVLLERDWIRWTLGGILIALPFGALAALTHAVIDSSLDQFPPEFMTAGSATSTWVLSTLAAWAGAIQLLRWRTIRARRARQSSVPVLRLEEPGAGTC